MNTKAGQNCQGICGEIFFRQTGQLAGEMSIGRPKRRLDSSNHKKETGFSSGLSVFNSYRLAGPLITALSATIRVRRDQSGRTGAADQSALSADSPLQALSPTAL